MATEEVLLKRVLPNSIEAEQSVIGSMIIDREAITIASEIINPDDFYNKQYGILFETMIELNDESKPVDLITLQDRLKEKDVPPEVSSLEFIRDIIKSLYDVKTANRVRILYGGSVKPNNIKSYLTQKDVDGALVGGASLDPTSYKELLTNLL